MVKKAEGYIPTAETIVNLGDGSYINPEIVRAWIDIVQSEGQYRYRTSEIPKGFRTDLTDALTSELRVVIHDFELEDGNDWNREVTAEILGDIRPDSMLSQNSIRFTSGSYLPQFFFHTEARAQKVEAGQYDAQAFVTYRIADHIIQRVEEETRRAAELAQTTNQLRVG